VEIATEGAENYPMTVKGHGYFVTGTDTGVGKTFVAAGLARTLRSRGINIGVMKPVETGFVNGVVSDSDQLREAGGAKDPVNLICPYRFAPALAPLAASEIEGRPIRKSVILKNFAELSRRHEFMLVEGAGGLLVPVTNKTLMADLAFEMGLKLLIVSANVLGCINHTLLTLEAARSRKLKVAAVLLNDLACNGRKFAAGNQRYIEKWGKVKVLFVPYNRREKIDRALANYLRPR
jgi:dethiobiotin synthetase